MANSFDAYKAQQAQARAQHIEDTLRSLVVPQYDPQTAVRLLGFTSQERLLNHLLAVTADDQSPWLINRVLALHEFWTREDVGLPIVADRSVQKYHALYRNVPAPAMTIFSPLPEFKLQGEQFIDSISHTEIDLNNAAAEHALAITQITQGQPFNNVTTHLLLGCSIDVMGYIPQFLRDRGFAQSLPRDEMWGGYKIVNINPKLFTQQ